jgi:hypothetical protein
LALIKEKGDAELLNSVISLFQTSDNDLIKAEITDILCTLKSVSAVPVLAAALENPKNIKIRKDLLTGCWMSGLTFENSLSVFVDIFLNADFLTAFEAFTVIENCVSLENQKETNDEIRKLKNAVLTINPDKKQLYEDLIILIENGNIVENQD